MTQTETAVGHGRTVALGLAAFVLLALAGLAMPKWLTFLLTMAAANGLVSLGIVGLMRGGVVPFGQGMMLALGGYAAALAFNKLGVTDALLLALGGGVVATLVAAPFAAVGDVAGVGDARRSAQAGHTERAADCRIAGGCQGGGADRR